MKIIKILLILAIIIPVFLPFPSELGQADTHKIYTKMSYSNSSSFSSAINRKERAKKIIKVRVTAYSSTYDQCDSSPFITASGTHVHDGTLAANCLPFGAKVRLPNYFGNKIFTVEDRLAPRLGCSTVDIWFPDRASALQFGSTYTTIEII